MFAFIMNLVELACAEIEVDLKDIHEVEIDPNMRTWSVRIGDQEAFFMERGGKPFVFHVNCYD